MWVLLSPSIDYYPVGFGMHAPRVRHCTPLNPVAWAVMKLAIQMRVSVVPLEVAVSNHRCPFQFSETHNHQE